MTLEDQILHALSAKLPEHQTPQGFARLAFLEWATQQGDPSKISQKATDLSDRMRRVIMPTPALRAFHALTDQARVPLPVPTRRGGRAGRLAIQRAA